ncbi:MAG: arginine repressor, partial [Prevotella sp.]|nr:arginine repressor [Prevotella sp.]
MREKSQRLEALRLIISSRQLGSQEELLAALQKEGFKLTQATLSRDLKLLKVAKAATMGGSYVYVLPIEALYKRVGTPSSAREMMQVPGFVSIQFSGNICV